MFHSSTKYRVVLGSRWVDGGLDLEKGEASWTVYSFYLQSVSSTLTWHLRPPKLKPKVDTRLIGTLKLSPILEGPRGHKVPVLRLVLQRQRYNDINLL